MHACPGAARVVIIVLLVVNGCRKAADRGPEPEVAPPPLPELAIPIGATAVVMLDASAVVSDDLLRDLGTDVGGEDQYWLSFVRPGTRVTFVEIPEGALIRISGLTEPFELPSRGEAKEACGRQASRLGVNLFVRLSELDVVSVTAAAEKRLCDLLERPETREPESGPLHMAFAHAPSHDAVRAAGTSNGGWAVGLDGRKALAVDVWEHAPGALGVTTLTRLDAMLVQPLLGAGSDLSAAAEAMSLARERVERDYALASALIDALEKPEAGHREIAFSGDKPLAELALLLARFVRWQRNPIIARGQAYWIVSVIHEFWPQGSLPPSTDALLTRLLDHAPGEADRKLVRDPWGASFVIDAGLNGAFMVCSRGADKRRGTKDDICATSDPPP